MSGPLEIHFAPGDTRSAPGAAHQWGHDPWEGLALGDGLGVPAAIGGEITAASLLGAYRRAIFCQPRSLPEEITEIEVLYAPDVRAGDIPVLPGPGNPFATSWWSPPVRYCIPVQTVHIGRTLARVLRHAGWATTTDCAFDHVIEGCRTNRRPQWLTAPLVGALRTLYQQGWAHSVEVWRGDELIGGLFGCAIGGVFVMDSAFHLCPEAAKVAIVDLATRARSAGIVLLDAQVRSEYTIRLGARETPRSEYLAYLSAGDKPIPLAPERLPASRLLAR